MANKKEIHPTVEVLKHTNGRHNLSVNQFYTEGFGAIKDEDSFFFTELTRSTLGRDKTYSADLTLTKSYNDLKYIIANFEFWSITPEVNSDRNAYAIKNIGSSVRGDKRTLLKYNGGYSTFKDKMLIVTLSNEFLKKNNLHPIIMILQPTFDVTVQSWEKAQKDGIKLEEVFEDVRSTLISCADGEVFDFLCKGALLCPEFRILKPISYEEVQKLGFVKDIEMRERKDNQVLDINCHIREGQFPFYVEEEVIPIEGEYFSTREEVAKAIKEHSLIEPTLGPLTKITTANDLSLKYSDIGMELIKQRNRILGLPSGNTDFSGMYNKKEYLEMGIKGAEAQLEALKQIPDHQNYKKAA